MRIFLPLILAAFSSSAFAADAMKVRKPSDLTATGFSVDTEGNVTTGSSVTAGGFFGDGSNLTGISAGHTINKSSGTPDAVLTSMTSRTNLAFSTMSHTVVDDPDKDATIIRAVPTCLSNWTAIENKGRRLGCLQTAEEGSGTWETANEDCWDTYGAVLPPLNVAWIAASNFSGVLTDITDDKEWIGAHGDASNQLSTANLNQTYGYNEGWTVSGSNAYRCWIPK